MEKACRDMEWGNYLVWGFARQEQKIKNKKIFSYNTAPLPSFSCFSTEKKYPMYCLLLAGPAPLAILRPPIIQSNSSAQQRAC